jgi:transcriptional regulator with XRE-family HTH domain
MEAKRKSPVSPIGQSVRSHAAELYQRDPEFRAERDRLAPYRAVGRAVINARVDRGLTQAQLAEMIGTKDTGISRIESGRHAVSLQTLQKLSNALDITFVIGSARATARAGDVRVVQVSDVAVERTVAQRARRPFASASMSAGTFSLRASSRSRDI